MNDALILMPVNVNQESVRGGISMKRMKALSLLTVLAFALSIFTGCNSTNSNKSTDTPTTEIPNEMGNTFGNMNNHGIFSLQGDWIYFANNSDNGKLYKVKIDDTGEIKLSDDQAICINVIGEWVYYFDFSGIYRIKTNGTGRFT